jgi:hypothetical protein
MAPPAKKQKTKEQKRSPIIFQLPGYDPDTRLTVFYQDFNVHSMILKTHSAFFRKFMDSPDKVSHQIVPGLDTSPDNSTTTDTNDASTTADISTLSKPSDLMYNPISSFRYNWVSEVDENGIKWHLVCADSRVRFSVLLINVSINANQKAPFTISKLTHGITYHIGVFE